MSHVWQLMECHTCDNWWNVTRVTTDGMSHVWQLMECHTCDSWWNVTRATTDGMSHVWQLMWRNVTRVTTDRLTWWWRWLGWRQQGEVGQPTEPVVCRCSLAVFVSSPSCRSTHSIRNHIISCWWETDDNHCLITIIQIYSQHPQPHHQLLVRDRW